MAEERLATGPSADANGGFQSGLTAGHGPPPEGLFSDLSPRCMNARLCGYSEIVSDF
jgi:hypothetical protein